MEEKRPGEYFPIEEDEQGTYILNSRDMCMIDHLRDLTEAGLSSLKIEGRAKSAYYAAIVTGAYRHGLMRLPAGKRSTVWRDEVEHVSHRPYSTGFYYGPAGTVLRQFQICQGMQVVALVADCDPGRQCHTFPAQQIPHRRHRGTGGAGPCVPLP